MAANVQPIFTRVGQVEWGTITTANTNKDGTGTVVTVFTADADNGGYVEKVVFQPIGSNVATAARIFINNGSTNATAANNTYYTDVTLAISTLSEVATMASTTVFLGLALPPGYKLNITIGTTVAAGYHVTGVGGKY